MQGERKKKDYKDYTELSDDGVTSNDSMSDAESNNFDGPTK